jgi:hypothetical protein
MSRSIVFLAVASSALLLLAGCASGTVGENPTPSTVSQDEGAASPAPTATATPQGAQIPADASTWIVDYEQIGGVRLGESAGSLAQAAGLPPVTDTTDCPPGYSNGPTPGTTNSSFGITVMELDSRGEAIPDPTFTYASVWTNVPSDAILDSSPSTPTGIRLGSTESDLLAAYPRIQKTHSKYDESMGYTTYAAGPVGDRFMVFQVAASASGSRSVFRIQSSSTPYFADVCD